MRTSANGIAVLHYFERCRLRAYPDPATGGDPWTIGWGDTGPDVVQGLVITQEDADTRFARRLSEEFEPGVLSAIDWPIDQGQFDGMVCLAYNIGVGAFKKSTLVKKFNQLDYEGAAQQFQRWDKAAGRSMKGLRRRRAAETALFMGQPGDRAIAIGSAVL